MAVTVTLLTGVITSPVLGLTLVARTQTPVGPKPWLHSVFGGDAGGSKTVPPRKSPEPRRVIWLARICTLWWYTPGLTSTVSPGLARLTAAWIDCPGPTTIVLDDAEADAA